MRIFLLARHGESLFNVGGLVNGDPARDRGLSEIGQAEARTLGDQISGVGIDLAVTSEFPRARDYRTWKRAHVRSDPFPGGESLDDAASRYARAYRAVLARPERIVLVVCHEIPVRYAVNAAAGSPQLDAPAHDIRNAVPYIFGERQLETAVAGLERLAVTTA